MEKSKLQRFIQKYYLNGNVSVVALESANGTLSTRFLGGNNRSLRGEVKMDGWEYEEGTYGIRDTEKLLKLLGVVDSDISVSAMKSDDRVLSLKVSDDKVSFNFMLSDLSIIPDAPPLKKLPEFEVKLKLDDVFMRKFVSGKEALAETESFTILTRDGDVDFVINYASMNTTRVTVPTVVEEYCDIEPISFSASILKEIIKVNKECSDVSMEISSQGLIRLVMNTDDFESTYYMVAVENVG